MTASRAYGCFKCALQSSDLNGADMDEVFNILVFLVKWEKTHLLMENWCSPGTDAEAGVGLSGKFLVRPPADGQQSVS